MTRNIDKIRVPVRLASLGCDAVEGILSLSPNAELRDGPETLLDRLNAPTRIVPFLRAADSAVLLLVRTQLEWVLAGPGVRPEMVHPPHFMATREEQVRVRMIGGACHEGVLAIEMPTEFNRLSDFLNRDEDFFALLTTGGTLLLNKACLVDVSVRGAGSLPRAA
jgi:hypothetical protein